MFFTGISSTILPFLISSGFIGLLVFYSGAFSILNNSQKDDRKEISGYSSFDDFIIENTFYLFEEDKPESNQKIYKTVFSTDSGCINEDKILPIRKKCNYYALSDTYQVYPTNIFCHNERGPPINSKIPFYS